MREDVETRLTGAAGALATAVVAGALQAGKLGTHPFALQVTGTAVVLAWLPFFFRTGLVHRLPNFVSTPLALLWVTLCFGPVFVAFILELFLGHQRPGMSWYNALWRIYAILGLWIVLAVVNERWVRPWWRLNSDRILGPIRSTSIAEQSHQIAMDKRSAALEAIKARVRIVLNKKKMSERIVERKKGELKKAGATIERAERMLKKAQRTAQECDASEKSEAMDVIETMKAVLEDAVSHEKGLQSDIEAMQLDLEDIKLQLENYQSEWTEALHIQNYTAFYR